MGCLPVLPRWVARFRTRFGAQALIDIKYAHPSVPERTASSPSHIEISYPEKPIPAQDTQLLNTFFKQQDLLRKKESDNCLSTLILLEIRCMGDLLGLDGRTPNLNGLDESNTLAHCHPKYAG